jgi:signal peptidase II
MIESKRQGYILAVLILIIDQISKFYAVNNFNYVLNTGAAWGILKGSNFLLIIVSLVAIFYIIRYFKYNLLALSLLLGGILGNVVDRIFKGHVIDFINIKIFNYPLFNIADMFIVTAVILLIIRK